jgi:hypothetical protein
MVSSSDDPKMTVRLRAAKNVARVCRHTTSRHFYLTSRDFTEFLTLYFTLILPI